ncbi:uncharacterized protein LOC131062646 [Cryptomeria japonica]|uniref:uncharacterized protein LOC131062646 n=1 Tax=Cryptomeria japonica TaxID=3369 RepID=UPI0025AC07E4|nr:uncharacterized protein LOC131062646 [Cryptomeria japonica]
MHRNLLLLDERSSRFVMVRCRKKMQKLQFTTKNCFSRSLVPLLFLCFVTPLLIIHLTPSLPIDSLNPASEPSCEKPGPVFAVENSGFCIGACTSECFPRVKNLCISRSQVAYCKMVEEKEEIASTQLMHPHADENDSLQPKNSRMPSIMRFHGETLTVPVENSCNQEKKGIPGLSLVADQRYLPSRKPNPHHEAEKIIPALLFTQSQQEHNHTFYWFSSPSEVSEWGKGFLKAFNMDKKVKYTKFPDGKNSSICFDDAIVFSAGTTLYYVPDQDTNDWLRQNVLQYCSIPIVNASWPPKKVAILDRISGSRRLQNKDMVAQVLFQKLGIHARQGYSGNGSFCDQVREVAEEDLVIVPHGSQNVNLLFARKGAVVIEIFPYLYYTSALKNYTHAAQLHVYSLLGDMPNDSFFMRPLSLLGWDSCFKIRWCKNYARKHFVLADIEVLKKLLGHIEKDSLGWRT